MDLVHELAFVHRCEYTLVKVNGRPNHFVCIKLRFILIFKCVCYYLQPIQLSQSFVFASLVFDNVTSLVIETAEYFRKDYVYVLLDAARDNDHRNPVSATSLQ